MSLLLSEIEQDLIRRERYISRSFNHITTKETDWYTMILYNYNQSSFINTNKVRKFFACSLYEKIEDKLIYVISSSLPLENNINQPKHLLYGHGSTLAGKTIAFICGLVDDPKAFSVRIDLQNSQTLQDTIRDRVFGVATYNAEPIEQVSFLDVDGLITTQIDIATML